MAYRWVVYNSPLGEEDGCIIGAGRLEQLEEALEFLEKGPLDEKTCERIDGIWKKIEHEAGVDNFWL
jgi:aryl-alcohol dehydrogenase-like predicted oxidoreductase